MPLTLAKLVHRLLLAAALSCVGVGPAALAAEKQKTFGSPEEAVKTLLTATAAGDIKALESILGPGSASLIRSGDAVADRAGRERFAKAYESLCAMRRHATPFEEDRCRDKRNACNCGECRANSLPRGLGKAAFIVRCRPR